MCNNSDVLASWLAALGSVGAVVVAVGSLLLARARDLKRARRAQAELISAWFADERADASVLAVRNGSEQPVYEVVVTLVINGGAGVHAPEDYKRVLLVLPPGRFQVEVPNDWRGMSAYPGAEVAFTDATGNTHWVRAANGSLDEIEQSAIEHYDMSRPFPYDVV